MPYLQRSEVDVAVLLTSGGGQARLGEIFRRLTGKSRVSQGHLEWNAAKGISDEHGPRRRAEPVDFGRQEKNKQ